MASHRVMVIERDEQNASDGKPDLEWLNRVKICFKLKCFYNQYGLFMQVKA